MKLSSIIAIIVVLLLILGAWLLFKPEAQAPVDQVGNEEIDDNQIFEMLALASGTYEIAPQDTVSWKGSKPLLDNYYDNGTLTVKSGEIIVGETGEVTGEIVLDMSSIRAISTGRGEGEDRLSNHLKSPDFFDAETHPEAKFSLNSIDPSDEAGNYIVNGDLTIKNITNPITFPATITNNQDNTALLVEGSATLDRSKWDVRFGSGSFFSDLGDGIIDDNFTVTIDLEIPKIN